MNHIPVKKAVDESGEPKEVIIPWKNYREIEEIIGLDLNKKAIDDLQIALRDRASGKKNAYVALESV